MSTPVKIENEFLSLDVWPQFGGKVSSMIDRADGYELLFSFPAELPTRCQYGTDFSDGWCVGWDECFPSVEACVYPAHPYTDIRVPDHGEIWSLPTTAVPNKSGITTVWHGLRFGYRLTRKLYLEGSSVVNDYTLVNLAPFEFRYAWAMHAMLSIASPPRLYVPGSAQAQLIGDIDLAMLPPSESFRYQEYTPINAPARITYPMRQRALSIEYVSNTQLAYWQTWINTGAWAGHKHVALYPCSSPTGTLEQSATVSPMGRVEWSTKLTVSSE